ncbi:glycosyltransferase [Glycomyces sp. A-F 0318]|uniref:glycosyltransferase n=1 Tax=Glycomyces amatae TaxID=2881355 RepID=UPI001E5E867E|nr:glycosyltransferase [Glycomyces amatae]MCD0443736.1 glycosyltransferase [Glycomyces amatae]
MGGTIRTTLNTAESLADLGHQVRIATVGRNKAVPDFAIDPRIEVLTLWDQRPVEEGGEELDAADRALAESTSLLETWDVPGSAKQSALTDRRVRDYLRTTDADVVVGTNLGLNLYLAEYGRRDTVRVAQEHLYFDLYPEARQRRLTRSFRKLDAVVTTTEIDARRYREAMPRYRGLIECVPNSIPACGAPRPAEVPNVIVGAGRISPGKGFDTLIRAFARVADGRPDWRLRICGRGPDLKRLEQLAEDLRVEDKVEFPGAVMPIGPEWANAAIAVVPSHFESFGLTVIEAMGAGAPLICSKVPNGPIELVDDEVNGVFFKSKDWRSLQAALERLIGDPGLRAKLAEGGRETARRYEPDQVVQQHAALFERLVAGRR